MATETSEIAPLPCPFCGASLYSDSVVWFHPGVITDRDCVLSGMGFYDYELAAWNTRATPALPEDVSGLIERLRNRAKQEREIAENSRVVAALLQPEFDKFEVRDAPWNLYAVRMAVDHQNGHKRDAAFADDLDAASLALQRLHRPVPDNLRTRAEAIKLKLVTWFQPEHKGYPTHQINPDGDEAVAVIDELLASVCPVPDREALCRLVEAGAPSFDSHTGIAIGTEVEALADAILALLNQETTDHVGEGDVARLRYLATAARDALAWFELALAEDDAGTEYLNEGGWDEAPAIAASLFAALSATENGDA